MLQAGGTRYQYDSLGNLVRKTLPAGQEWHYSWNAAGHLAEVLRPDGHVVRFTYDALGRRISKCYQGRITHWVWDGDKLLHEWSKVHAGPVPTAPDDTAPDDTAPDMAAKDVATWVFEDTSFAPLAKLTTHGSYGIVCDHLGTPIQLHDTHGHVTWQAELDSYGRVRRHTGETTVCPFRYQGQYEDAETSLYYNRFRYYDPETGNYISQDPIGLDGGLSLYEYVTDTNKWIDPYGLATLFELGTYGSLNGSTHVGDGLQAHELIRHEFLVQKGLASKEGRLSGNPSIALDNVHHTRVGGAHWHEARIRAVQGLGRNDFHSSLKRELDITQGGLRKAGVKASTARKLRKQSEKFYKQLQKQSNCP